MTPEEDLQALREENRLLKALAAELFPLKEQLAQATARFKELEARLSKDSCTSSKPPSSDGLGRLPRSSRRPSGKPPGGQQGHAGHRLQMVEQPDEVLHHRSERFQQCGQDLSGVAGQLAERRQVVDLPEIRLWEQEHQIESIICPSCQSSVCASFPAMVNAPVQYGPNVQALAIYLHQGHLLPIVRTCEVFAAICCRQISEGTFIQWSQLAAERLAATVERTAELIAAGGMLHWLHVNCIRWLTHLAGHESRGREALDEIGIWPTFAARAMHDRFAGYGAYDCAHSLCGAHLLCDCATVARQVQQEWACLMHDFLLDPHGAYHEWQKLHLRAVPLPVAPLLLHKGRAKQSLAKNLLDALLGRAEQVLALFDDLRIPFTNNQAERDLRMAQVQQKVSGTFRSATRVTAFCRIRSYLPTMHKQGHPLLAIFHGHPFPVAWNPE